MKTIGLIGGMSWESTETYYRLINEGVRNELGGLHSAEIVMRSVDFAPVEVLQREAKWQEAAEFLTDAALSLQSAGAELIMICTNTMHIVADIVESALEVPFLHIADPAGRILAQEGKKRAGLLGTEFTMNMDFYKKRLREKFKIDVVIPPDDSRKYINRVIYDELCLGKIKQESKKEVLKIIDALSSFGAEGVILGCTEIPLLIQPGDAVVPVYDTTALHARAAVEAALS